MSAAISLFPPFYLCERWSPLFFPRKSIPPPRNKGAHPRLRRKCTFLDLGSKFQLTPPDVRHSPIIFFLYNTFFPQNNPVKKNLSSPVLFYRIISKTVVSVKRNRVLLFYLTFVANKIISLRLLRVANLRLKFLKRNFFKRTHKQVWYRLKGIFKWIRVCLFDVLIEDFVFQIRIKIWKKSTSNCECLLVHYFYKKKSSK